MLYVIICTYELCMIRCIFDATYFAQEFPHFWTFRSGKTKNLQQLLQTWTTGPSLCFLVFFMFFSFYFSLSEPPSWKLNRENYPPINKKNTNHHPPQFFVDFLIHWTPHTVPLRPAETRARRRNGRCTLTRRPPGHPPSLGLVASWPRRKGWDWPRNKGVTVINFG